MPTPVQVHCLLKLSALNDASDAARRYLDAPRPTGTGRYTLRWYGAWCRILLRDLAMFDSVVLPHEGVAEVPVALVAESPRPAAPRPRRHVKLNARRRPTMIPIAYRIDKLRGCYVGAFRVLDENSIGTDEGAILRDAGPGFLRVDARACGVLWRSAPA